MSDQVWMPKSPKMTSKQKVAYVLAELGAADLDNERSGLEIRVIQTLREHDWKISEALFELRAALSNEKEKG